MGPAYKEFGGICRFISIIALLTSCNAVRWDLPATAPVVTEPAPASTHVVTSVGVVTPSAPPRITAPATTAKPTESGPAHIMPQPLSGALLRRTTRTVLGLYLNGESTDGEAMVDNLRIEQLSTGDLRQHSALVTGSLTSRVLAYLTR
jgi:hypothetical protein